MATRRLSQREAGLKHGYRSGLEQKLAAQIKAAGIPVLYEEDKLPFTQPAASRTYRPDFRLHNGILIESKGRFTLEDRKKHIWFKDQHPAIDLRLVFSNANAKLRKGSPTSYAQWAEKNGFLWAHKWIPEEWLREPVNQQSLEAIEKIRLKK